MDFLALSEPYLSIYEFILGRLKLNELLEIITEYKRSADDNLRLLYDILKNVEMYKVSTIFDKLITLLRNTSKGSISANKVVIKLFVLETLIPFLILIHREHYTIDNDILLSMYREYGEGYDIWNKLDKRDLAEKFLKAQGFIAGIIGYKMLKDNKLDMAEKMFKKARDIHIITGDNDLLLTDLFNLGITATEKNDFKSAVTFFEEALKVNDKDKEIWRNLGVSLRALGKHNNAIKCFRKALELDENYTDAKYNLAHTLLEGYSINKRNVKWMKEGLKITSELLEKGWKWTLTTLLLLGAFYFSIEEYDKAAKHFNDAVDIILLRKYKNSTMFEIIE